MALITTVLLAVGLVLFPSDIADASRNALTLCFSVVIPSLFPFFVLSSLTTESGIGHKISLFLSPMMRRVFRIGANGAAALLLGILGGYPVGANCIKNLYIAQDCTKKEAEHLLGFCNNSGPSFILGAVGIGVFGNMKIGAFLLAVHILSALTVGVFFSFFAPKASKTPLQRQQVLPFSSALCSSVKSGLQSSLNVCAFVLFFAVLTEILHLFSILPYGGILGVLCGGLFEITSGIAALQSAVSSLPTAFTLAAFLLGFGGLSVHAQTLSILNETDLSPKKYFLGKCLHAVISTIYAAITSHFLFQAQTVFAPVSTQTNLPGLCVLFISLLSFLMLLLFSEKKTGK